MRRKICTRKKLFKLYTFDRHRRTAMKNPATRNRTRDHLIAAAFYSQMLYQLSYSRLACKRSLCSRFGLPRTHWCRRPECLGQTVGSPEDEDGHCPSWYHLQRGNFFRFIVFLVPAPTPGHAPNPPARAEKAPALSRCSLSTGAYTQQYLCP